METVLVKATPEVREALSTLITDIQASLDLLNVWGRSPDMYITCDISLNQREWLIIGHYESTPFKNAFTARTADPITYLRKYACQLNCLIRELIAR